MAIHPIVICVLLFVFHAVYISGQIATTTYTSTTGEESTTVYISEQNATTTNTSTTGEESTTVYISGQNATTTNTSTTGEESTTESSPGSSTPTTQSTETKEVVNLILVITICVLGTALLICIVIIVILRLTAIKKRRISTTAPECDTQPLEVKNEEATSP